MAQQATANLQLRHDHRRRETVQHLPYAFDYRVGGIPKYPVEHNAVRCHVDAEVSERPPDRTAEIAQCAPYPGVLVRGERQHVVNSLDAWMHGPYPFDESAWAECCREAAAAAAKAQGAVDFGVNVCEFACQAVSSAVKPPVQHQAGANAVRDLYVDEVRHVRRRAELSFSQGAEVRVVLHPYRDADLLTEFVWQRRWKQTGRRPLKLDTGPSGCTRTRRSPFAWPLDRGGHPHDHAAQVASGTGDLAQRLLEQEHGRRRESGSRIIGVRIDGAARVQCAVKTRRGRLQCPVR